MIPAQIARTVRSRAGEVCEYCRLPEELSLYRFHIEHVRPRSHGGGDDPDNLALACPECNWRKGPNLTGIDPDTGLVTELFNPRTHQWTDHFSMEDGRITARSAQGRTTLWLFDMNGADRVHQREIHYRKKS